MSAKRPSAGVKKQPSGAGKKQSGRGKQRPKALTVIRLVLFFFIGTVSMTVFYYIIIALFVSTDTERRLRQENDMYEREVSMLEAKEQLLADVVSGLTAKDDRIYMDIFQAHAPETDPFSSLDFLSGIDSIPDHNLVMHVAGKLDDIEERAASVEENFRHVMAAVASPDFVMPPMNSPLGEFSFAQTGASVGEKMNPFYKIAMRHNGLDMIAPAGRPVYASADGTVTDIIRSRKGLGNVVVITHDGGYVTKYAHLEDVEAVKGRTVSKGTRIGHVGVSGNSFAPHLHYEVWRDSLALDPVNCFFASVTPHEYVNMLIMSAVTGQSMD